jgi:hypothetical protein
MALKLWAESGSRKRLCLTHLVWYYDIADAFSGQQGTPPHENKNKNKEKEGKNPVGRT